MYFFNFIYYISRIVFSSLTNLKSTEQWGKTFLHELEEKFGGKFDNTIVEKVSKYQSIQLHYVANAFSKLNGRLNNEIEKERNILFFLMSVLPTQNSITRSTKILTFSPNFVCRLIAIINIAKIM